MKKIGKTKPAFDGRKEIVMEENIIKYLSEIECILAKNTKSQSDEFAQGLRYCDCIRQELENADDIDFQNHIRWIKSVFYL